MILASQNGLMCVCKIIRETQKAWIVKYPGEGEKETRVAKDSGRRMFSSVSDAARWIITESAK